MKPYSNFFLKLRSVEINTVYIYLSLLAFLWVLGCTPAEEKAATSDTSEPTTTEAPASNEASETAENTASADAEGDTTTTVVDVDSAAGKDVVVKTIDVKLPEKVESETTPTSGGTGKLGSREVSEAKLTTKLELIARDLEAKNLAYRSDLGQDCSGIYHKIKDMIQERIPALADESKYTYPAFSSQRSSRQIADWYYNNNNLHIVQDALAESHLIRPGSVMFYGRTDELYSNLNIGKLANANKFVHDGVNGKIMHIAVVTSVEKDDEGNLTKYTIMHGRNKRHPASRSAGNWNGGKSTRKQHQKFPFGNWNQQWVAVANIETMQ